MWANAKQPSIEASAEYIHTEHPDMPRDLIETHLFGWLESSESYSERRIQEFDWLTALWPQTTSAPDGRRQTAENPALSSMRHVSRGLTSSHLAIADFRVMEKVEAFCLTVTVSTPRFTLPREARQTLETWRLIGNSRRINGCGAGMFVACVPSTNPIGIGGSKQCSRE